MVSGLAWYFKAHFQDISLKELGQNLQKVLTAVCTTKSGLPKFGNSHLIESFRQNLFKRATTFYGRVHRFLDLT